MIFFHHRHTGLPRVRDVLLTAVLVALAYIGFFAIIGLGDGEK